MKNILMIMLFLTAISAAAQPDRRDVRRGNRDYKKENWKEAEIEYRKGIVKDSLSVAANYNLAADLYRQNNPQEAQKVLDRIKEVAPATENAADYYYNLGDVAIANQDWQSAVTAFEQSLLRNPGDLDAKENYIYAKKKLQQQQNQQNQQQNDQNQQQPQNQQGKEEQQEGGQRPEGAMSPEQQEALLQAIQAEEDKTQDKLKEKAGVVIRGNKNW